MNWRIYLEIEATNIELAAVKSFTVRIGGESVEAMLRDVVENELRN